MVSFQVHPRPGVPSLATITVHLADELFEAPWGSEADRWQKISDTLLHQMVHLAIALDARAAPIRSRTITGNTSPQSATGSANRRAGRRCGKCQNVGHNADAAFWPDNAIDVEADSGIRDA